MILKLTGDRYTKKMHSLKKTDDFCVKQIIFTEC